MLLRLFASMGRALVSGGLGTCFELLLITSWLRGHRSNRGCRRRVSTSSIAPKIVRATIFGLRGFLARA